jgi:hypothetical protein
MQLLSVFRRYGQLSAQEDGDSFSRDEKGHLHTIPTEPTTTSWTVSGNPGGAHLHSAHLLVNPVSTAADHLIIIHTSWQWCQWPFKQWVCCYKHSLLAENLSVVNDQSSRQLSGLPSFGEPQYRPTAPQASPAARLSSPMWTMVWQEVYRKCPSIVHTRNCCELPKSRPVNHVHRKTVTQDTESSSYMAKLDLCGAPSWISMPSRQGVLAQWPRDPSLTSLKNPSYFAPSLSIAYYALLFGCPNTIYR